MERFLYRLSVSDYAEVFYLKGALLFWVWNLPERRTTMDIDLLGFRGGKIKKTSFYRTGTFSDFEERVEEEFSKMIAEVSSQEAVQG